MYSFIFKTYHKTVESFEVEIGGLAHKRSRGHVAVHPTANNYCTCEKKKKRHHVRGSTGRHLRRPVGSRFVLYKIFVYFEAAVHQSAILSPPAPTCIVHPGAILLRNHWIVYDSLSDLPFVCCIP